MSPGRAAKVQARIKARADKEVEKFRRFASGFAPRHCPICDYEGMFTPFGMPPRIDAHCPSCGSLERHRLYALLIARQTPFGVEDRVLHFSAKHDFGRLVQPLVGEYVTTEIRPSTEPDIVLDIEAIDLPDGRFSRVICNHVLEHVDHRKALAELFRILTPGGRAFLTTPVIEGWGETYENPDVEDRRGRILHFGQQDHSRLFGSDLRDFIREAGFSLSEFTATEPDVHKHGLWRGETIFIARRPEVEAA